MENTPRLISIKEACRQLGIGRTTFYHLRESGELKGVCRIGGRTLVSQAAIDEFIAQRLDENAGPSASPTLGEGRQ